MNQYDIDGIIYEAKNEYDATKKAYRMAERVNMVRYLGEDKWNYSVRFSHGNATVLVVRLYPIG